MKKWPTLNRWERRRRKRRRECKKKEIFKILSFCSYKKLLLKTVFNRAHLSTRRYFAELCCSAKITELVNVLSTRFKRSIGLDVLVNRRFFGEKKLFLLQSFPQILKFYWKYFFQIFLLFKVTWLDDIEIVIIIY